jgi:transposase
MRPAGNAHELESRRRNAIRLLKNGLSLREVAAVVDCSPSSVQRWKDALRQGGEQALGSRQHPGARSKLTVSEKEQLVSILRRGARKAGYRSELWTCPHIAQVIAQRFGVSYHVNYVPALLRSLHWSPQKPEQRARERDEAAIARWREHDWPRIKKGAGEAS